MLLSREEFWGRRGGLPQVDGLGTWKGTSGSTSKGLMGRTLKVKVYIIRRIRIITV